MKKKIAWKKIITIIPLCCLIGIILWSFLGIFLYMTSTKNLLKGEGEVLGKVIDTYTEKPIEGAQVRMGDVQVQSDSSGNFVVKGAIGSYNLSISKEGYKTVRLEVWASPEMIVEKEFERIKLLSGEGVIEQGKGNTINLREETFRLIELQLHNQVFSIIFTIPAILAAILVYKKLAYRTTLVLTLFSMGSGGLNGIGFMLAPVAILFLISMKEEFAEIQWAKQFGKVKSRSSLHYLINPILILLAGFLVIHVVLIFLAPLVLPSNSVPDLGGGEIILDNQEFTQELSQPWRWIYEQGDFACHQMANRSLYLKGNQFPFCARCTGRWVGFTLGLLLAILKRFRVDWKLALLLALIGIVPIAIDGGGQFLGYWESINLSRLITGFLLGAFTTIAISSCLRELENPFFGIIAREEKP
jgi:uncharacterized membrane protein